MTKALNDQIYATKMRAANLGHALAGKPRCICGYEAQSAADMDDHLIGAAFKPERTET